LPSSGPDIRGPRAQPSRDTQPRTEDFAGVHPGSRAVGTGAGRGGRGPSFGRDNGLWRNDCVLYVIVRSVVPRREALAASVSHAD
jgi:hypothetical protein